MRLEGFDVVFGLATPAIDLFIEHASVSLAQVDVRIDGAVQHQPLANGQAAAMFGPDASPDALPEGGAGQETLPDARRGKRQRRASR